MRTWFLVVCLLVAPSVAEAQGATAAPQIDVGARVRIWTDTTGAALKARVQSIDQERLTIGAQGNAERVLPLADIDRIDVSRGRNRGAWTAVGMLVGATAGIVISRADNDEGDMVGGLDETAEGLANTISGALVGGALGFLLAPERWRTVWRR